MSELDDGDDDPKVRSMRAVWLQMRDEDPPDGGLAELLAAARTKAETMAAPSWWQRLAMQLRRPAVFALASVMLVLGGALLVGRRVEPSAEPTPAIDPGSADETTAGRAQSIEHLREPPAKPTPPPAHPTPPPPPPPPPPEGQVKSDTTVAPPKEAANQTAPGRFGLDGETSRDRVDEVGGEIPAVPPVASTDAAPPPIDQLRKQCDDAARRGDCAAVRSMVQTLERRDRQFRAKLAKDSPVNRCLSN